MGAGRDAAPAAAAVRLTDAIATRNRVTSIDRATLINQLGCREAQVTSRYHHPAYHHLFIQEMRSTWFRTVELDL